MAKNEFIKINPDILVVPQSYGILNEVIIKLKDTWKYDPHMGCSPWVRTPNQIVSVTYQYGPRKCDVRSYRVKVYKRSDGCYVNLAIIKRDELFTKYYPDHLPKLLKALLPPTKNKVELES